MWHPEIKHSGVSCRCDAELERKHSRPWPVRGQIPGHSCTLILKPLGSHYFRLQNIMSLVGYFHLISSSFSFIFLNDHLTLLYQHLWCDSPVSREGHRVSGKLWPKIGWKKCISLLDGSARYLKPMGIQPIFWYKLWQFTPLRGTRPMWLLHMSWPINEPSLTLRDL